MRPPVLICGPQGCGKTRAAFARFKAEGFVEFTEVRSTDLESPFRRGNVLAKNPGAILCECGDRGLEDFDFLWLLYPTVLAERKMRENMIVPTPFVIFTMDCEEPPIYIPRFFEVIRLGGSV